MDSCERLMKSYYLTKKGFHSNLNMEDTADVDYRHAKRVYEESNNKNLRDYYDLYVQINRLLLADVFEKFRNK